MIVVNRVHHAWDLKFYLSKTYIDGVQYIWVEFRASMLGMACKAGNQPMSVN